MSRARLPYVHWLLIEGRTKEIWDEIDRDPTLLNSVDRHHMSLLARSIELKEVAFAKQLIEQGACVQPHPRAIESPLRLAIVFETQELMLVVPLVEAGANVNERLPFGGPLHIAVEHNKLRVAEFLLQRGASVNAYGDDKTPLHIAVQGQNVEAVKLLCRFGADPMAKDQAVGFTPFDLSDSMGTDLITNILKRHLAS